MITTRRKPCATALHANDADNPAERLLRIGAPVLVALAIGFGLLASVGFAGGVHDVAHDTRHSFAFPCH